MTISNILRLLASACMLTLSLAACRKEPVKQPTPPEQDNTYGIVNFVNPVQDRQVSSNGETVSCVLMAKDDYLIDLVFNSGGEGWAELTKGASGISGRNTVRLVFEKNMTDVSRELELFIQVKGYERVSLCTFVQMKDSDTAAKQKNVALNTYMHRRLQQEYLWEEYNSIEVDLSMDYTQFLNTHLLKLGNVNVEDGGTYRGNSADAGKRFIYSNIQEVAPITRAMETAGLGLGPMFISTLTSDGIQGLSVAYVHKDSPAWKVGMKRGDTIFKVNGTTLTSYNVSEFVKSLYYTPSGSYELEFYRNADMSKSYTVTVTTDVYDYNPILYYAVYSQGSNRMGYLVLENFDMNAQDYIVNILHELKNNNITDLTLDLRFNPGGSVAQSRYIASAIVGSSHMDDIFVHMDHRDGNRQSWKFRGGPNEEDGLGIAPDLGLNRLFVICSEITASASELIINSLNGIDFPVYLFGSRTEGKNVGMTATQTVYDGHRYIFSPITFRVSNAKGFGAYPEGFVPHVMVNNQNGIYSDDADNMFPYSFGDWGDFGRNVALNQIFRYISGSSAIDEPVSVRSVPVPGFAPVPVGPCDVKQPLAGRFGNIVYMSE